MQVVAKTVGEKLLAKGCFLSTAESCTGGLVAKLVTDVPGSSQWFERGFITYTNRAKREMLGVSAQTLSRYGAVSEATVREMAQGAVRNSQADSSIAISGIAGPTGGSEEKPVGTVCMAWLTADQLLLAETCHFAGDREQVRESAALHALQRFCDLLG